MISNDWCAVIAHIGLAGPRRQPGGRIVGGLAKRTHLCGIAREFPGRRTRGASNRRVLSSGYRVHSHRRRGEHLKGAPRQGMDCDWRTQDGTSLLDPCALLLRKARYSSLQLVLCPHCLPPLKEPLSSSPVRPSSPTRAEFAVCLRWCGQSQVPDPSTSDEEHHPRTESMLGAPRLFRSGEWSWRVPDGTSHKLQHRGRRPEHGQLPKT